MLLVCQWKLINLGRDTMSQSGKIGRHLFKAQSDDSGMAMAMAYLKLIVEGPYIIEFYTNKKLPHLMKKVQF